MHYWGQISSQNHNKFYKRIARSRLVARAARPPPWVAQDVICFDSFLGQKMFDKVIVKVSLSVVVVIFWLFRPVIVTVVNFCDVLFRILVPNLFYFDLGYFLLHLGVTLFMTSATHANIVILPNLLYSQPVAVNKTCMIKFRSAWQLKSSVDNLQCMGL